MKFNYTKTEEGKRRFENKEAYQISLKYQSDMGKLGIAAHNHFSNECTVDFCCCEGDNIKELRGCDGQVYPATQYKIYIPSFKSAIKLALEELFEECKHGDREHQDWLENKFNNYLRQYD